MSDRPLDRARHIKESILNIRNLLRGRSFADAANDTFVWAAFERFLEIVSEASRNIPDEWKNELGEGIPWRQIAGLGNLLRHAYDQVNAEVFWQIYENDLDPLEAAIDAMLTAHGQHAGPG